MLRINEFQIYVLAAHVHPLTEIPNDTKYSDVWYKWMDVKNALQTIFKQRALEVCLDAANELYAALRLVIPDDLDQAVAKLPNPATNTLEPNISYNLYSIREAAKKFEIVLAAELSNSDTYWIEPKGTHKTSVLLQQARAELPASLVSEMPEAATEFDEAGRCLLFENSTAVGFHLMRATEAVIRKYYEVVIGKPPAVKYRNWGAYIKRLKECDADKKVTGYLDHIRENYRNPVLHPEVTLTSEEAQILFGVCVSAIVMMNSAMKSYKGELLPLQAAAATGGSTE